MNFKAAAFAQPNNVCSFVTKILHVINRLADHHLTLNLAITFHDFCIFLSQNEYLVDHYDMWGWRKTRATRDSLRKGINPRRSRPCDRIAGSVAIGLESSGCAEARWGILFSRSARNECAIRDSVLIRELSRPEWPPNKIAAWKTTLFRGARLCNRRIILLWLFAFWFVLPILCPTGSVGLDSRSESDNEDATSSIVISNDGSNIMEGQIDPRLLSRQLGHELAYQFFTREIYEVRSSQITLRIIYCVCTYVCKIVMKLFWDILLHLIIYNNISLLFILLNFQ